jgi:predicted dehydrogenase
MVQERLTTTLKGTQGMTTHSKEKIKLAIIGCGAVIQKLYLPVADSATGLAITHVVDLDLERAREVANLYQIPNYAQDYRQVLDQVDAVVVATPPGSHASISIDCLDRGLPVLCEKPLTPSVEQAQAMIAASQRTNTILAVGMVRRLSWSSQLVRRLLQNGILGDVQRFDVIEGHEFNWPLFTGHIFQTSKAGGVLADTGTHLLDLLSWVLGGQRAQLFSYKDDNWGGVEMNAVLELAIECDGKQVPGKIEISFTRKLRNTLRIYGAKGYLEAPVMGGPEVLFYPDDGSDEAMVIRPHDANPLGHGKTFALQLENFADAIINQTNNYATADEALPTISIIEQCHRSRERIAQPWEVKHLESFFGGKGNE